MNGAPNAETPAEHVESLRALINEALPALVADAGPDVLYDPVRYVLDGGGKRIRPVLLLLDPHCGGEPEWEVVRQTRLLAPETITVAMCVSKKRNNSIP